MFSAGKLLYRKSRAIEIAGMSNGVIMLLRCTIFLLICTFIHSRRELQTKKLTFQIRSGCKTLAYLQMNIEKEREELIKIEEKRD